MLTKCPVLTSGTGALAWPYAERVAIEAGYGGKACWGPARALSKRWVRTSIHSVLPSSYLCPRHGSATWLQGAPQITQSPSPPLSATGRSSRLPKKSQLVSQAKLALLPPFLPSSAPCPGHKVGTKVPIPLAILLSGKRNMLHARTLLSMGLCPMILLGCSSHLHVQTVLLVRASPLLPGSLSRLPRDLVICFSIPGTVL